MIRKERLVNMEVIDLQAFEVFIKSRGLVPEKNLPYYLSWVRKFLQATLPSAAVTPNDRLKAYIDQLGRDTRVTEWQIQQASRAVDLYQRIFLKEEAKSGEPETDSERDVTEAEAAYCRMRELMRIRHYAYRSEQTYLDWTRKFIAYATAHDLDWRKEAAVRSYLSYLATALNVAASTQNQAFNALLFLQREVLGTVVGDIGGVRAKRGPKLPVVLTAQEVSSLLKEVEGDARLMLELTYGAGLRVSELVRMRVKDLDFDNRLVFVRAGKGDKDRSSLLPRRLVEPLKRQLQEVKVIHDRDLAAGHGSVYLPFALDRKYVNASREYGWQYLFPARDLAVDPRSGVVRRHHIGDVVVQRAMRMAVQRAGIIKPASVHTLRHSFATHLLLKGVNIREVQKYLGHESVETTMIYTHVIRGMDSTAESPLDEL
jgi:integron integrase